MDFLQKNRCIKIWSSTLVIGSCTTGRGQTTKDTLVYWARGEKQTTFVVYN